MKTWKHCLAALALMGVSPAMAHGGGAVIVPIIIPGGGGAPVVPHALRGDYSGIHTVAVVSALGQELTLGSSGLLAQHKTLDVSDWNLDDKITATLSRYLATRFKLATVPYDRAALAHVENGRFDNSAPALHDYLAALPNAGIDAFIVLRPDAEDGTPQTPGLSLSDPGIGLPVLSANYEIDVVDAHSLKVIGHAFSRILQREGATVSFVQIIGPKSLMVAPDQTPTPAQREAMGAGFTSIVKTSLIETLNALDLGIALPKAGARTIVPIPPDKSPFKSIKSVGVISAIGSDLMLDHRGAWFVHDNSTISIADWQLDGQIEAMIAASLDKKFTVKPVSADRAKLAKLDLRFTDAALNTPVDGLSPSNDVDAYVVVVKHTSQMQPAWDTVSGLGIWYWTPMGDERSGVYANYTIMLVDAHSLKPIWMVWGVTSPARPSRTVYREVPNGIWPDKDTLSPAQAATVKQTLSDELSDSIPETLLRMGLTGMMISDEPPPAPSLPKEPQAIPAPAQ
jgi:hypothetical protein